MTMSQAHQEAYARANLNVIHAYCVEMRHAQFAPTGIVRYANYDQDIDMVLEAEAPANPGETVTFIGIAGQVSEGGSDGAADSPLQSMLDGVSGLYQGLLYNAAQTSDPVQVTTRIIGYNLDTETVVGVAGILQAELLEASMDLTNIRLTSGYQNSVNVDFPGIKYTPESNPGLY